MTRMLASVASEDEVRTVLRGGADLIDLKDPAAGALGALAPRALRELAAAVGGKRPVSATTGDLAMDPGIVQRSVRATAACGVDYVKLGITPSPRTLACIEALAPLARTGVRVVLVMFADRPLSHAWTVAAARSGCAGVMLDTAEKDGGGLLRCAGVDTLRGFVDRARGLGLMTGLAGSLQAPDVDSLLPLAPDFLGFRGALCAGPRDGSVTAEAVARIRARIPRHTEVALEPADRREHRTAAASAAVAFAST